MAEVTIEQKIRAHYQSENNEWLVEKGKVKEARLLKEAVERIEYFKQEAQSNYRLWRQASGETYKLTESIRMREIQIARLEERFNEKVDDTVRSLQQLKKSVDKQ